MYSHRLYPITANHGMAQGQSEYFHSRLGHIDGMFKLTRQSTIQGRDGPMIVVPFGTITIETAPQDAQNLIYILSTSPGALFVTLRHPSDRVKNTLVTTTVETLTQRPDSSTIGEQFRQPASVAPVQVTPALPAAAPAPAKRKKSGFRNL